MRTSWLYLKAVTCDSNATEFLWPLLTPNNMPWTAPPPLLLHPLKFTATLHPLLLHAEATSARWDLQGEWRADTYRKLTGTLPRSSAELRRVKTGKGIRHEWALKPWAGAAPTGLASCRMPRRASGTRRKPGQARRVTFIPQGREVAHILRDVTWLCLGLTYRPSGGARTEDKSTLTYDRATSWYTS